jgi:hypothetical protein
MRLIVIVVVSSFIVSSFNACRHDSFKAVLNAWPWKAVGRPGRPGGARSSPKLF